MNKERREALEAISSELDGLKDRLAEIQQDEQDYYDNMAPSFQGGQKGDAAQEAADKLQECVDGIESAIDVIAEVVGA